MCCGTKRIVEIRCLSDCGYLSAARSHPAAVVQRRQQRDLARFVPALQGLTDRQSRLLLLLASFIARHAPQDFQTLRDQDIADATGTLAATLETATRGVIYEHRARTQPAQRLADELKRGLEEIMGQPEALDQSEGEPEALHDRISTSGIARQGARAPGIDQDAIVALRRIEQSAREMRQELDGSDTGYRDLLGRLLNARASDEASAPTNRSGGLIIP